MRKLAKQNEKTVAKEKVRASVTCNVVNLPIQASASLMQTRRVIQCIKTKTGHPEN